MPADATIANEALNIDVIRQQLATHTIGRRIVLHEVVASTNASLRELADAGALVDTEGHLQVKDTRKRVHTVVAGEIRLIQRA
jgi:hypothetical protein